MTTPNPNNRRSLLTAYIDEKSREPFAYGTNDCIMVTAGAVEAITGVDHAAEYRGCYTTLAGGKKLIGKSPLRFVADRFAAIPEGQAGAHDGDIAVMRQGREWAFGVFIGAHVYAQAESGMGILPRSRAVKAFRVQ